MPDAPAILALLWRASWQGGVLILLVLALRYTLRDRLPAAWRCRLWGLVFLRLLLPAVPASPLSLFNLLPPDPPAVRWPTRTVIVRSTAPVPIDPSSPALPYGVEPRASDRPTAVLTLWLGVAAALATLTVIAHVALALKVRRSQLTVPPEVAATWHQIAGRRGPPPVVTDAVSSPALFGVLRGRLLLPPDLWARLSPAELRLVFRHELAHVRRRDLLVGWAAVLIRCVYWFHPLVWVAVAARRADAEAACDDAVLAATGDRAAYGRTLLAVAGGRRVPAIGMADGRTDLRRRLVRITTARRPGRWSAAVAAGLTAAVGCATLTRSDRPANVTRTYAAFWPPDYNIAPQLATSPMTPAPLPFALRGPSLADAIRTAITPATWGHHGTVIAVDGVNIHVTAPEETQAQIERMIADRMVQASVSMRIISAPPSLVRRVGLIVPGPGVPVPISTRELAALVRAVERSPGATVLTAPRVTLFSGQHSVLIIETKQAYVRGVTPVITPTEARFDSTESSTPAVGVTMAVAATVVPDRTSADLATRVVLDRLQSMDRVEMTATVGRSTTRSSYQVPHHRGVAVDADARVPSGGSVWTRGQAVDTYGKDGTPTPATRASADEPATFIIWTVNVLPARAASHAAAPATPPLARAEAGRYGRQGMSGPILQFSPRRLVIHPPGSRTAGPCLVTPGMNALAALITAHALPPAAPTPDGRGTAMPVPTELSTDGVQPVGAARLGVLTLP